MTESILCLDLGTKTGWAAACAGNMYSGWFSVAINRKKDPPGRKWRLWREQVSGLIESIDPQVIFFEDVKAHAAGAVLAAHAYGGYRAFLEWMCATRNIELVGVGVGEIKKNWTGKGNADKPAMVAEAHRRGFPTNSEDEVDAIAIRDWALKQLEKRA